MAQIAYCATVRSLWRCGAAFALGVALLHASAIAARADAVEDFLRGKSIDILIGASSGNDFDFRGRMLARHMGKHIPGHPAFIVRNMPGGGGVVAMNHMAARAAKDGTTLHMMFPNMGALQATNEPGVAFDLREFRFIGNTTDSQNVMSVWHTSPVKTIEEAKRTEIVLGATPGNTGIYYARALNQMIGTKFKIISGYPVGNEINLAMERGEIHGRASITVASWKSTRPQWFAEKKVLHLLQAGASWHLDLPEVQLMHELVGPGEDRQVLEFLSASVAIASRVVTTPGVPPERLAALRRAFDAVIKSPELLEEAAKTNMDISPLSGEECQRISDAIVNAPSTVVAKAKAIMQEK